MDGPSQYDHVLAQSWALNPPPPANPEPLQGSCLPNTSLDLDAKISQAVEKALGRVHQPSVLELCNLPPITIPAGLEIPKYQKYDGTSDPNYHLRTFILESLPLMAYPDLLPYLFLQSLAGDALIWMTNMAVLETQSFRQVALSFINQFSHRIKVSSTIMEVTQDQMKANEDFADFANRVRDMAT